MVVGNNELTAAKNAGKSMAISIAMAMQRFDAERIAQWSTSIASLESTGCHHRLRACAVLPQWPPWSTNLIETHKTLPKCIQVFTQNHWMPPLGDCLRCIAVAAAMADEFVETTQNTYKTQLFASNYGTC